MALVLLSCGGEWMVGPLAIAEGHYELTSVNGNALPWEPPPSTGLWGSILDGHLLLQRDHSFRVGIRADVGRFLEGRWRLDGLAEGGGRVVILSYGSGSDTVEEEIVLRGDSAVWAIPATTQSPGIRYVFQRTAMPRGTMSGRYALTRVNGHEEQFVVYEELQGSDTYQLLIAFDTLEFLGDGLFFRQHRSDGTLRRDARGDIVAISMNEWTTAGSYVRDDAGVILRAHGAAAADTLVPIAGETTFRQSWQILDTTVEAEYTRVP